MFLIYKWKSEVRKRGRNLSRVTIDEVINHLEYQWINTGSLIPENVSQEMEEASDLVPLF